MSGDLIGAVETLLEDRQGDLADTETNTCTVAIDQLDIVLAAVRPVVQELLHGQIAVLARQQDRIEEELASIARNVAGGPEKVSANGLDSMPPAPDYGYAKCTARKVSGPNESWVRVCTLPDGHPTTAHADSAGWWDE